MKEILQQTWRGWVTALRTLTVIPWPGRDADALASALPWFPLVGGVIGAFVFLGFECIRQHLLWPAGAAAFSVAGSAALTGGLHLDGFADTLDGWCGGKTRARRLEIMKDSRIGAMGAIGLILVFLLQYVALARFAYLSHGLVLLLPLAYILSRLAMTHLAVSLPYARTEGGTAENFVKGAWSRHYLGALLLAALLCGAIAGLIGLGAVLLTILLTLVLRHWMLKNFGGITGDLLGFASVVTETVLLLAGAAAAPFIPPALFQLG